MVFLSVSVAWMVLALDVSVEIRTVRIGKPEGKRVATSSQRFAPPPSAADCPPEDHRSLSLERVLWSRTPPARAWGGVAGWWE